jgi:hypothetical protein
MAGSDPCEGISETKGPVVHRQGLFYWEILEGKTQQLTAFLAAP